VDDEGFNEQLDEAVYMAVINLEDEANRLPDEDRAEFWKRIINVCINQGD
jgi:hypothetical protein